MEGMSSHPWRMDWRCARNRIPPALQVTVFERKNRREEKQPHDRRAAKSERTGLAGYLARSGQFLLPMVDLIDHCRMGCDELIEVTGRAAMVIYIDGLIFGDYTMMGVVGVDVEGIKHVLGIREGATENSTVVKELLGGIVAQGVDAKRKMLFVIDGTRALRAAINAVDFSTSTRTARRTNRQCRG